MTRNLKYVVYQEDRFYVSQCLNVDVASFGETIDEAVQNLKEAVELYFDNEDAKLEYHEVGNALIGEAFINA
ncbi:MAG: type II toxin-antitoxin system HicB family antitoxin [Pseudomonadota bacterium]